MVKVRVGVEVPKRSLAPGAPAPEEVKEQLSRELHEKCESFLEGIDDLLEEYRDYLSDYDRPAFSFTRRAAELYYYLTLGNHNTDIKNWIHDRLAEMGKDVNPADIEKLTGSFDEFKAESVRRVIKACEESPKMPVIDFIDKSTLKRALDRWSHTLYLVSRESPDDYCYKYYVPCNGADDDDCDDDPCPWLDEYFDRQEGASDLRDLIRDLQNKNIRTGYMLWDISLAGRRYAEIVPFIEGLFGAVVPYVVDLFDKGHLFDVLYRENIQLASRMFRISKEEAEKLVDAYFELPSRMPSYAEWDC